MSRQFLSYSVFVLGGLLLGAAQSAHAAEGVALPAVYPSDSWQGWSKATIRVLDRLESRSTVLTLSVGEEQSYRSLTLKVLSCVQRPPTLAPETAAKLHIEDSKAKVPAPFEGWILANQPSVSVYQSSLYNVQVVQCGGEKVPPMIGALPSPTVPQLMTSEPARLDADGHTVGGQGGMPLSPQGNPQASGPSTAQPTGIMSSSPGGTLPPPTPLLP